MDKYTIDLDKLLNDFEYSELTEQNNIVSSNCQNSQPYQKTHATQKHSINNVFHSLNEYLNTDIRSELNTPGTSLIEQEEVPVLVKKVVKDEIPSIEQIFNNLSKDEECENSANNNTPEVIDDFVTKDVNINCVNGDDEQLANVKDELINVDQDLINVDQDLIESEADSSKISIINDDCIEVMVVEEPVVKDEESIVNECDINENTPDVADESVVQNIQEIIENIVENVTNKQIVKFEDSVELSDTEIENELEQLEQEYQTKLLIETEVEETVTVPELNNIEENKIRPNSLELPQDNLTINLIGEPGSTPYNNVYVSVPEKPLEGPAKSELSNSLSPTLSESSSTYDQSNSDNSNTSDSCNDTSLEETAAAAGASATINNDLSSDGAAAAAAAATSIDAENANIPNVQLGKTAPFWTPDSDALSCLHCDRKFTVINRRHHCRACGLVLCSKCSNLKCKLEYMDNQEARVCFKCFEILQQPVVTTTTPTTSESDTSPEGRRYLKPNNPMEYCSKVPPLQQASGAQAQPPPSVLVPVGVLKRKGSAKGRGHKSVMFMDGIRPGCDLTELDTDFNYKQTTNTNTNKKQHSRSRQRNLPKIDPKTLSYIPAEEAALPPVVNVVKSEVFYAECPNDQSLVDTLKTDLITFAIQRNFHIQLKIINMDCCINKVVWCFATDGLISVGQDEIVILLEFIDNERTLPKDVFLHLNNIYNEAVKGTSIVELGISIHPSSNFLESKNHAGFLYIKPTFQCVENVLLPKEPYLIGILIHRWETPWAKIFPLRLLLRLGAEYRYYPSPIVSTRHRESVYVEIGHTIINLLADFRNFSYTIPSVRGLTIHMEDKNTSVSIPMNRYDQVMKALNNSSEHILAFSANFSPQADSHLVCIQDTHGNNENAYTTHAINIHNKPRKVTGASFIILNGALKSSSGLTAKSSIIEDGLMIHILPEQMQKLRVALKNMKDFKISCGCVNAQSDETISILWTDNDIQFNIGVTSPIDNMSLNGVPSIRVHNGRDFICNSGNKMIRWTEVFIIQSGEELMKSQDPIDISKISENISKGTSQALVKYLDLLATNSCTKIGIRTNLNIENVSYLAGSNGSKLPPIYMKSLDNELIPVLHKITSNFAEQVTVVLELKFHILNV